jgi:hypothetical protein
MSRYRFTEEEVRAIFERAAVRQEEARRAEEAGRAGLSVEELQRIGAEVGIDPAHVAAAAEEIARRGASGAAPPARTTFLGMPTHLRQTRLLPAPLDDATWERVVADLRRQFATPGLAGEVGRQREWTTAPGSARHGVPVRVTVEPEGTGSRVTIEQSLRRSALPFAITGAAYGVVALVFGVLLAAGALGSDGVIMPVLFAAMALLMFGGAQVGFRLYAARQERRFEAALDRLERIARDAAPAAEAAPALPDAAPRLDLDRLPDPEEPEEAPTRRASWRTRS